MDDSVNLSVAIHIVDRKIANLNLKLLKTPTIELKDELEKYLNIKKEIYKGNKTLIDKVINENGK